MNDSYDTTVCTIYMTDSYYTTVCTIYTWYMTDSYDTLHYFMTFWQSHQYPTFNNLIHALRSQKFWTEWGVRKCSSFSLFSLSHLFLSSFRSVPLSRGGRGWRGGGGSAPMEWRALVFLMSFRLSHSTFTNGDSPSIPNECSQFPWGFSIPFSFLWVIFIFPEWFVNTLNPLLATPLPYYNN